MTIPSADDQSFRYTAIDRSGRQVKDVVRARDGRAAARALIAEGLTPISVTEERARAIGTRDRELNARERVAVLRQLALMVAAGVNLLEAMQTVAQGIVAAKGRHKFEAVIASLKRGDTLAHALEVHAPGLPFYVYAMVRVGEATGQVGEVLKEAAEQMAYEDKLRREVTTALVYPAILITVGIAVVMFLMLVPIPRFAEMMGDRRDQMPALSRVVFALSDFLHQNLILALGGVGVVVAGIAAAFTHPAVKARTYTAFRNLVLIGPVLRARELNSWARLLGFALTNGVNLLEAAGLARRGAPEGAFRRNLEQFERDLKGGVDVAESLSRHTELTSMDLSLLRAGAKSGTLPRMFLYVAEGYDDALRDGLRRLTTFVQPIAILIIAVIVALLALAIVLAMVSLNQTIVV